jgi:hypothetical protein
VVLEKEEGAGMIVRLLLALTLLLPVAAFADSSALILGSVPGTPEHEKRFDGWIETTRKTLVEKLGFAPERVLVLSNRGTARAEIEKAFTQLKSQLRSEDTFFLFLIGHGSFDQDYKLNIFGQDLTAADYSRLISTLSAGKTVVINATSASGGSIESLAGKNRVVVTATRSGQEGNETFFYEYFLGALQSPEADEDKDQKISVWEAFKFANAAVERFFKEQTRLATEHAQISDSGAEKTGAALSEPPLLARSTVFNTARQPTSSNPAIQALLNERTQIEQKIEALRRDKAILPEAAYEAQLEELLVQLALKNQQIREQERR